MNESIDPSKVSLSFLSDLNIALIRLAPPGTRAVTLDETRLASFAEALTEVAHSKVKGLVITGPNEDMFCVGADISIIGSVTEPSYGESLALRGQGVFDQLEALQCKTIAAISGPCVGGGCELVLACKHRIISSHSSSIIGLPETKLGIIPGFGGTQRLPRLIGLPKALDIILAGKTLRAPQALKAGLVDSVFSPGEIVDKAMQIACGKQSLPKPKLSWIDKLLTFTPFGRSFVSKKAGTALHKQTGGFYPAPPLALAIATKGLGLKLSEGLKLEAKGLGDMIVTKESKALVNIFFLTEAAKNLGKNSKELVNQAHVTVIGAGVMGAGIASSYARVGNQALVRDMNEEALKRGKDHVTKELQKIRHLSRSEKAAAGSRIEWSCWPTETLKRTDLVIEAVFESMDLKKKIFSELSKEVRSDCVLASNTSSLSISEMASAVSNPERVIGMHFFNPVERMPLVEIIRGKQTSDKVVEFVAAMSTKLGKYPIVVEDVPGFLVNRILIPYLNEAIYLLVAGHGIEAIDNAALAFGMPMGPIRLLDEVGLDVASHVAEIMVKGYGERMAVNGIAAKLVEQKRFGRKSGRGFYIHEGKNAVADKEIPKLLGLKSSPDKALNLKELQDRLILHLVNEAYKCLEEGVAGDDRELAIKQIDLGTVMGIGFPPFRGGVMHYAKQRGEQEIGSILKGYFNELGIRYQPAPLLSI